MKDYMAMDTMRRCEYCGEWFKPENGENICLNCEIRLDEEREMFDWYSSFDYEYNNEFFEEGDW